MKLSRNEVFVSNVRAKLILTLFLFLPFFQAFASTHELYFGAQLNQENSYRDTLNPSVDYRHNPLAWLEMKTGAGLLFSTQDLESFNYRFEIIAQPSPWLSFLVRGSQRAQLPESFSRTCLLGLVQLQASLGTDFLLFASGGFYQRWVFLNQAHLFPFGSGLSFSQYDFATELGFAYPISSTLRGLMKIATFDPWEVYNLNNPFVETSFYFSRPEASSKWLATFRYQLLLGFGRLDRLTFGLTYGIIFN